MLFIFGKIRLTAYLACFVLLGNCSDYPGDRYSSIAPENTGDGLETGTLDEVNIDARLIKNALRAISDGRYKEMHSLLIYKDGKLVLEEYFPGHKYKWDAPGHHAGIVNWDKNMSHEVHSVTKSVTSACIGLAIEKGIIKSENQSIFDYLPDHQHLMTEGKDKITIGHLLTMTSGLLWDEWGAPLSSLENDMIGIWYSEKDPISYILERPLVFEPGTRFIYSGGDMDLLGEIIRNASGMDIEEFSGKYLFEPLGIRDFTWSVRFRNRVIEAAASLVITPRSMCKIGVTFLDNGRWKGEQIIPEEWVRKSSDIYNGNINIKIPGEDLGKTGYGYTWWIKRFTRSGKEFSMYLANGWGGQKIIVIPGLKTVIVLTGATYTSKVKEFKLLDKYILPAIIRNDH